MPDEPELLKMSNLFSFATEKEPSLREAAYTLILAPGVVRYLDFSNFLQIDVERLIEELEQFAATLEINNPNKIRQNIVGAELNFLDTDDSLKMETWEDKLRVHHALGRLLRDSNMPSTVYCNFHHHLRLEKHFAFAACLEAWVKGTGTWDNAVLAQSYNKSSEHILINEHTSRHVIVSFPCVFRKTDFVKARLNAMAVEAAKEVEEKEHQAKEAARLEEERREIAEDLRAKADLEALKKSQFSTFVYIMEDLRNGAFKIGHSKTPGKRERTLQSEVPQIVLRFSIPAEEIHERELHEKFSEINLRGEWFSLKAEHLLWVITFLKANGDAARASADYEWLGRLYLQANVNAKGE